MVAVEVEPLLVRPLVHEVAERVRLRHDEDVHLLEQRLEVAHRKVADERERRFLARVLVAVLRGRDEDGRLLAVEFLRRLGAVLRDDDEVDVRRREVLPLARPSRHLHLHAPRRGRDGLEERPDILGLRVAAELGLLGWRADRRFLRQGRGAQGDRRHDEECGERLCAWMSSRAVAADLRLGRRLLEPIELFTEAHDLSNHDERRAGGCRARPPGRRSARAGRPPSAACPGCRSR